MKVQMKSVMIENPQYRKERVKNDVKYALASAPVLAAGTFGVVHALENPRSYLKNYAVAKNYAQTQANALKNSTYGKKAIEIMQNAYNYAKTKLGDFAKTPFGTKVAEKATAVWKNIQPKFAGVKNLVVDFGKFVKEKLAKVPTKYKIAGAIFIVATSILESIAKKHSYNEGKIDGRYGK